MKTKNLLGSFILLFASAIWGFAFVAQTTGAESIPAFTFNCLRSYIAFIFLAFLSALVRIKNKELFPKTKESKKTLIIGGAVCGTALFVASAFQQYGIGMYPDGASASGRSGFITALYVIWVPIASSLIFKKRIHMLVWTGTLTAAAGMYLLCLGDGISGIYLGDILVLICSLCFVIQILFIDHYAAKTNGLLLSAVQFFTVGTLSFIAMLLFEKPSLSAIIDMALPILYLGIMSSGVAYTLQIVGQKRTEPTIASIVMSFESVFAAVGGALLLNERLTARELIGCLLVFGAIIAAQIPGFIKKGKKQ